MKKTLLLFVIGLIVVTTHAQNRGIVANPMNLNYRFQFDEPSRREAADPVCEYFNGKYYLFASKTGGYWSSPDLVEWTYIPNTTLVTQENYAPAILVHNNTMYYMIGGSPRIFATTDPDTDSWQELRPTRFEYGTADPAFYKDEDTGKVYIYWGCSDKDPIMGVEVDPNNNFKSIGRPVELIGHNSDKYGWEVSGKNNELNRDGWNEGPCVVKYKGKYYLQYAAPGTEWRIYGDGIYVGDDPLGPFTYMESSPFTFKPGGYVGGAGHGHTFQDKYGNYWHVASMTISVRHAFERRLGLFPVYFSDDNSIFSHTVWTDYPFMVPQEKIDMEADNCSMNWNLLSYGKQVSASSTHASYSPQNANDEQIESWWAAQTGNSGEWWQIDLGKVMEVNAIQVNMADQDYTTLANPFSYVYYQYYIEVSNNGTNWTRLVDRTENTKDMPHELIVLDDPVQARYLRITNTQAVENGKFSLSDFRVFGSGGGELPQEVTGLLAKRSKEDKRRFLLSWDKQNNVTGYIVRWGVKPNQMNNSTMVFTNQLEAGYFNRDSRYYFSIDAFNENGVASGQTVTEGAIFLGTPYGGTPWDVPGTIEAEDFNEGGQKYAYYDSTIGNSFLKYRPRDYVDIDQPDRTTRSYFLANTETGEYTNYTINVPETGLYDFDCIGASVQANNLGGFYLTFNGELADNPAVKTLPFGSKTEFHTTTLPDIALTKGTQVLTFNIQGDIYVDKFVFRKNGLNIQQSEKKLFSVYPNPTDGIFQVNLPHAGLLSVADINGRDIYSEYINNTLATIDVSEYSSGVYILSFTSENRADKTKLIKR